MFDIAGFAKGIVEFCCVARLSGEYWGKGRGRNLTKDSFPAEDRINSTESQRKTYLSSFWR